MRIKKTRIASTVVVLAAAVLFAVLPSCASNPIKDAGSMPQEQTSSVSSTQSSQQDDLSSSANAQPSSSSSLPPVSSVGESGEDEVIVYQHTDSTKYRSPVDTKDVTWEVLDDNEVRITSEKQEAVYAAEAGQVVVRKKTGWNAPFNYVLLLSDNGIQMMYRHLDNFAVEFGDKVKKGQKLGEMQEADGHYSFRFSINLYGQQNLKIDIPSV